MTNQEGTFGRSDTLPPIGDIVPGSADEAKAVKLIYARRQGIINQLATPVRLARQSRKIAAWGDDVDAPDQIPAVVHKIKQAIETQVSNHLKEPVKVTLEPTDTGEYAPWYWCGPAQAAQDAAGVGIAIDPIYLGAVTPQGQLIPPAPLPAQLVMQVKQAADQYPDMISADYVCKLNDQYAARTIQRKFDADWKESKAEKWLRSRVYANVVEGWQLPFYEYDPVRGHILNRNSIEQTYIAQEVEDIDDAPEAGIDLYMDLNEAIARYPNQRAAILNDDLITQGQLQPPQTQGKLPIQYSGNFRRPMVRKVVWWVRNHPVGVQLALHMGLVVQQQQEQANGLLDGLLDDGGETEAPLSGQPTAGGTGGVEGTAPRQQQPNSPTDLSVQDSTTGDQSEPNAQPIDDASLEQPKGGFFTLPSGQQVTPDDPHWPTAIAQISIINNAVVEYIVCPWSDIPLAHMRNTMIIGRPWGIGEPFYAKKLQDAYNNITESAIRHTEYNANAAIEMHNGLKAALEKEYGRAFVDPGKIIGIPEELWIDGKPLIRMIEPPPFPESSIAIRDKLSQDFNEIAGRPDVLTGNTPTPNASGELVANLQNAAVEPLNFKAQEIGYCVEKIATLMLESIAKFEDPAKMAEQLSMPLPLLMLVLQRIERRPPSIGVTISTGAGSVLERKRAQYVMWNREISPDDGLPLADGKTTRDILHGEADMSVRRSIEARKVAQGGQPQQQQVTESIAFKDLPPDGQSQMAAQAGIELSPADLAAHQQQQQDQKQQEMQTKAKQNGNGNQFANQQ